jgi:hypothetical protein
VEAETSLRKGAHVRITIESPRSGFLYVLNREEHRGRRLSKALLIFPTKRIRGGHNAVTAGRAIEIPALEDQPPYFTLKSADKEMESEYVGEVLNVMVTPQPLKELTIGRTALKLSEQQVRAWELRWGAKSTYYSMKGGVGKPMTRAERQAGASVQRLLTHEEPTPQTLYVVSTKPGAPFMVTVPVRVAR